MTRTDVLGSSRPPRAEPGIEPVLDSHRSGRRRSGRAEIDRLVSFTDAVVAILITLLVLGFDVPSGLTEDSLTEALRGLGLQLFSVVLSFAVIGGFWISHHHMFRHVAYYDDRLLALNGVFLLTIALLPFPTALLGEYMHYPAAMILYAASVSLAGMMFTLLWVHIAYLGHLLDDQVDPGLRLVLLLRFLSIPVIFLGTIPLTLSGYHHLTAAAWVVLPLTMRIALSRRLHHHPHAQSARGGPMNDSSAAARVYDRVADIYDLYTSPMEAMGGREARTRLFHHARGRVLELGIGTGASLTSYPADVDLTGIDISPRMLDRARRRAAKLGLTVQLDVVDIEHLPYPDDSFDTVTASCVFCSVPDPVQGLREAGRVTRPDGLILLFEHVRPTSPALGWLADVLSPLTRRVFGPELNRNTERNARAAGLVLREVNRRGVWRTIVASPGT